MKRSPAAFVPRHPRISRRAALEIGAVGLLGLGSNHLAALRAASPDGPVKPKANACIYIFLSGGLAQHESFDLKPLAPAEIRGEFNPIATATHDDRVYQAPNLTLPPGLTGDRFCSRLAMLAEIDRQRARLERSAEIEKFDNYRQGAISLLAEPALRRAIDVTHADDDVQQRYGRNSFGWSLLMAFRLIEAGVNLVQVNLGNNETWDTHGDAFPRLRDRLFPPTDRALTALLDDLESAGLLSSTMVVMAGEFGRTPKISTLPDSFGGPGRDHWGAVQTVFFAGGGVNGGTVIGSSDKDGARPATCGQRPENMAATIYQALGIPRMAVWHDDLDRPHQIYYGEPIPGLLG
jgi:hypothetical protein